MTILDYAIIIFVIGCLMAISFIVGAIWCCRWEDKDELYKEEPRRADEALKKAIMRKKNCKMYDETCEKWTCELCAWFEEEE